MFEHHTQFVDQLNPLRLTGTLTAVNGLIMRAVGVPAEIGSLCRVRTRRDGAIDAQVVGFRDGQTLLMPVQTTRGVAAGDAVFTVAGMQQVAVGPALLGRVVNGLGRPIDGQGRIHPERFYSLFEPAPAPLARERISQPLGTGIRCLDGLLTIGAGQRIGIFSGTGVGKSVLLGMIARYCAADVTVVAMVGERGREVKDFIEKDLGPDGARKAVLVVSTSDEAPVMRVRACFAATAIAEYFRDQGLHVLLLMDSLTRLAMAQRQIGLAAGEPPATKGYTPSVFGMLPQLLERTGRTARGSITGFYSVLVEGDDINEPVSDAVRGILDGHVWLSRTLAGRGHYPAVDVLNSVSRLMVDVVDGGHRQAAAQVRKLLATWFEIEDLVNIGAYASGSNPEFDLAIQSKPLVERFLQQAIDEAVDFEQARAALTAVHEDITRLRTQIARPRGATP